MEPGEGRGYRVWALGVLIASSLGIALLAVYQWTELLHVEGGGSTFCSINEVLNCVSVWESPFARAVHRVTSVPVAGWGVMFGLSALAASLLLARGVAKGAPAERAHAAVALAAGAGLIAGLVLFSVSLKLGAYCLTCIGTYVLVLAFVGSALSVRPLRRIPRPEWVRGLALIGALVVASYVAVLYPASRTSVEPSVSLTGKDDPDAPARTDPGRGASGTGAAGGEAGGKTPGHAELDTGDPLAVFLANIDPNARHPVAEALNLYRSAPVIPTGHFPARRTFGSSDAPVRLVEFSDIRCGHCKAFAAVLHKVEETAPAGSISLELRQFPLDGSCNAGVAKGMIDDTQVRCTAAKALICLESRGGFREAQDEMFQNQESLTRARVLEIAAAAGKLKPAELEKCIESQATADALASDVAYAMAFNVDGTPLVVVNGRRTMAIGPFLYALVLAGGDADAPGWRALPGDAGASR